MHKQWTCFSFVISARNVPKNEKKGLKGFVQDGGGGGGEKGGRRYLLSPILIPDHCFVSIGGKVWPSTEDSGTYSSGEAANAQS